MKPGFLTHPLKLTNPWLLCGSSGKRETLKIYDERNKNEEITTEKEGSRKYKRLLCTDLKIQNEIINFLKYIHNQSCLKE